MVVPRLLLAALKPFCRGAAARRAWQTLKKEIRYGQRHHQGARKVRRAVGGTGLRLHLGCGERPRDGWVNVDRSSRYADHRLDLRQPLPFADGSASVIYSEHVFEHLPYPEDAQTFLLESLRVLEPGGAFHVGVPDTAVLLEAYARGDRAALLERRQDRWPAWVRTPLDVINVSFRQFGDHHWSFDEETLVGALEAAGFVDARRRDLDPELDNESRRGMTLYVVARRPVAPVDEVVHPA